MIQQFFDTMIVASIDNEWYKIMTHQNLHRGKCWKLLGATF